LITRRNAYQALKYADAGIAFDPSHGPFFEIAAAAYEKLGDPVNAGRMRERASGAGSL
jgi:Tfp pilus assembly protein PilF